MIFVRTAPQPEQRRLEKMDIQTHPGQLQVLS